MIKERKEVLKATKKEDKDKFWGLFSLEGGKKDNMDYIVTVLKHVVHELEQEYVSNDSIYSDFLNLYHKVCAYRSSIQSVSQEIAEVKKLQTLTDEKVRNFESERIRRKTESEQAVLENEKEIENIQKKIEQLKEDTRDFALQLQMVVCEKDGILQGIEALKLQKPGFFSSRKRKTEYAEKNKQYSDQLQMAIEKERNCEPDCLKEKDRKMSFQIEIEKLINQSKDDQSVFAEWESKSKN